MDLNLSRAVLNVIECYDLDYLIEQISDFISNSHDLVEDTHIRFFRVSKNQYRLYIRNASSDLIRDVLREDINLCCLSLVLTPSCDLKLLNAS